MTRAITPLDASQVPNFGIWIGFATEQHFPHRMFSLRLIFTNDESPGSGTLTTTATVELQDSPSTDAMRFFPHEWRFRVVAKSDFTLAGGFLWRNPIRGVRIQLLGGTPGVGPSDVDPSVVLDGLFHTIVSRPKVLLSFDDGAEGVFNRGFPIMRQYGFRGVAFVYGQGPESDDPTWISNEQIRQLYDAGWDIAHHATYSGARLDTLTAAEASKDLRRNLEWMHRLGVTGRSGHRWVAWPEAVGHCRDRTVGPDYCALEFLAQGVTRMVNGNRGTNAHIWGEVTEARFNQYRRWTVNESTPDTTLEGYVLEAIKTGQSVMINYHNIVASGAKGGAVNEATFRRHMELISRYAREGQLDVVTLSELEDELANRRVEKRN